MANLSNINGKFVVEQTTGYVGVGTTDPSYPIEVLNASAEIALNASGASIYRLKSDSTDSFRINKNGVGDRLVIDGSGNSTFAGNVTTGGQVTVPAGYSVNIGTSRIHSAATSYLLGGNVGIGTTGPASKLDINGGRIGIRNNIVAASNLTYSTIYSTENSGGAYPFTGTSGNLVVEPRNGQDFVVLGLSGIPRMVVKGAGNVGIGVTLPLSPLSIQASSGASALRFIGRSGDSIASVDWYNSAQTAGTYLQSNGSWIRSRADGGFHFSHGSTPTTTDTDGFTIEGMNVGIGTTSPDSKLDVKGGTLRVTYNSSYNLELSDIGGNCRINANGDSAPLKFGTTVAGGSTAREIMHLDGISGNVGIGTSSPASKLEVSGRISGGELGNPKITRQGLTFYVDFNDKACISGESSTEKPIDLGPNSYDLTLLDGANFEYLNGIGTFYFDGSADRIQVNDFVVADTTNSYEIWHYANTQNTYETWWDSGNERPLLGTYNDQLIAYPAYSGSALGITITPGKWYHVVWAFNGNNDLDIFVNGVRRHNALGGTIAQRTGTFDAWLGGDTSSETTNGYIAIARTYSRQLTPDDVLQNYNAEVNMFAGVTPSLGIVQSGGNVGIGTISPGAKLDVRGSGGGYLKFDTTGSDGTIKSDYNLKLYADDTGDNSSGFGNMQFFTAGANERMRIQSNGNVGIGTTSPGSKLMISDANNRNFYDAQFKIEGSGYTAAHYLDGTEYMIHQNSNQRRIRMMSGTSISGVLLNPGATAWSSPSDERLKENIKPLDNVLDKIKDYRCVEYNFKNDKSKGKKIGFIAQDWVDDFPVIVDKDNKGLLDMKYTETIPVLLKAIQELKAEIEILKNK